MPAGGRDFSALPKASRAVSIPAAAASGRTVRVAKQRYQLTIFGGLGASLVLTAMGMANARWLAVAWVPLVATFGGQLSLLYWMWAAIEDEQARTTPVKAVVLMLIPLFNFYWAFYAVAGFATDYNDYITRRRVNAARLSRDLILAAMVIPVANLVIGWIALDRICDAVNALSGPSAAKRDGAARGEGEGIDQGT